MILTDFSPPPFFTEKSPKTTREKGDFQYGTEHDHTRETCSKGEKALEKVKRANAELAKVRREQKEQLRTEHNHHKYMMGGCILNRSYLRVG